VERKGHNGKTNATLAAKTQTRHLPREGAKGSKKKWCRPSERGKTNICSPQENKDPTAKKKKTMRGKEGDMGLGGPVIMENRGRWKTSGLGEDEGN